MIHAVHLTGASVDRGERRVIADVDFVVARSSWTGIIGANGSGKTSLLRAVAGRLPFAAGSCRVSGVDLTLDRAARARSFGFALPPEKLPDALRCRDVLKIAGGDPDEALHRLGDLQAVLNLGPLLDRWVSDCSAGMRQRIAIAAAFAGGHDLVILDEPMNWLDPVAVFDLREALRARVHAGLTLISALHDLWMLASACDAGLMLANGRIVETLSPPDLDEARRDERAFEKRMIARLRSRMPD